MTDPETMQRMARLQALMGGNGGGMGGLGALGGGNPGAGQQWPPPGTFGQPAEGQGAANANAGAGAAAGNPFAPLGGMGGGNMEA